MSVLKDPDNQDWSLLVAGDGRRLARLRLRDDPVERVAGQFSVLHGAAMGDVVDRACAELRGARLATVDEDLVAAMVNAGVPLERSSTDLVHSLDHIPAADRPSQGWSLDSATWDEALMPVLEDAYRHPHPDAGGARQLADVLREVFEQRQPGAVLPGASARLREPNGVVRGHVLTVVRVPWASSSLAWVMDVALHSSARGRGMGRMLLLHALHGTKRVGIDGLGLTVTHGNPARALYEAVGFRMLRRSWSLRIPS